MGSFNSFGGFSFSGFTCKNSFKKRDILRARNIQVGLYEICKATYMLIFRQSKCIAGSVSTNAQSSPKISSDSDKSFSITNMQVSVSFDTELDFLYGMTDGSTCKHTASCSAGGSTVENSQCGGATSVTFKLPDHAKNSTCDVGVHNIGFDCSSAASTVQPVSSSTSNAESQATSVPAIATSVAVQNSQIGNLSTSLGSLVASAGSAQTENTGVALTTSTIFSTSLFTVTSCAPEITNCPARSTQVVTSVIAVGTTVCPVSSSSAGSSSPAAAAPSAPVQSGPAPTESSSAPAESSSGPTESSSAPTGSSSVPANSVASESSSL